MTYFKITNESENHHGLQYHDGLVEDILPFQENGSCVPGGIYFTNEKYIPGFLNHGIWLREVQIPEDAKMVQDPEGNKWRASKVILGSRRDLREVSTWEYLVQQGADIHANNDAALIYASYNGYIEVIEYLVEKGVDIHVNNDEALRYASNNGQLEIVKYLVEKGSDIHACNDAALRNSSYNGYIDVVKYLVEKGADIHANNDEALRYAALNGNIEVVKYLQSIDLKEEGFINEAAK